MSTFELPQLAFSTRSPQPSSGSDFVRQIIAESRGIDDQVRQDFSRRADIAGSVLSHQPADGQAIEIFTFSPVAEDRWLLARTISLGLYRKGSHHLLVHGVVLGSELLDALEGNPLVFAAADVATLGFAFLDRHPGLGNELPIQHVDRSIERLARSHNGQRLGSIEPSVDGWLASAYDTLATGGRLALAGNEPRAAAIEQLLLHFHPDDRRQLSFHTFYSHSREVPYRLIGLLDEDVADVSRQQRDLKVLDLTQESAAKHAAQSDLGTLAIRARRIDSERYRQLLTQVRLTHWSHRQIPPIGAEDAGFALRLHATPGSLSLSGGESIRWRQLQRRAEGRLGYLLFALARSWQHSEAEFSQSLDAVEQMETKIAWQDVVGWVDGPPSIDGERWILTALLSRDAFDLELSSSGGRGERWRGQRWQILRRLWSPAEWQRLLASLDPTQVTRDVIEYWTLEAAKRDDSTAFWRAALGWLGGSGAESSKSAKSVETTLAARHAGAEAWQALASVYRDTGDIAGSARIVLQHQLPAVDDSAAARVVAQLVDDLLRSQALADAWAELGRCFDRPGCAAAIFDRLAARCVSTEFDTRLMPRWQALFDSPPPLASADAFGWLVAEIALIGEDDEIATLLDRACAKLDQADIELDVTDAFARQTLAAASASLLAAWHQPNRQLSARTWLPAASAVLDLRARYGPLGSSDGDVINLAILGRTLATIEGGQPQAHFGETWRNVLLLAEQGTVFDLASSDLASSSRSSTEARWWLASLQDELALKPLKSVGDEQVELRAFLHLAWSLWSRAAAAGDELAALSMKLRWASALAAPSAKGQLLTNRFHNPLAQHRDWHLRVIRARVPDSLQARAQRLLAKSTGSSDLATV